MTRLYLTRHGQTEWNVEHRMQGQLDSPLTELGKEQAKWLRKLLDLGKKCADIFSILIRKN